MHTYTFTLLLSGADFQDPNVVEVLYAAGCTDATFGTQAGVSFADFDREANTLVEAVLSAVEQVERAVPRARVTRVEPEDLVSASDIAVRTGRTRASVSYLIDGERGPGDFPPSALRLGGDRPTWHWSEVVSWFSSRLDQPIGTATEAHALAALNAALELRRAIAHAAPPAAHQIANWLSVQPAMQAASPSLARQTRFSAPQTTYVHPFETWWTEQLYSSQSTPRRTETLLAPRVVDEVTQAYWREISSDFQQAARNSLLSNIREAPATNATIASHQRAAPTGGFSSASPRPLESASAQVA